MWWGEEGLGLATEPSSKGPRIAPVPFCERGTKTLRISVLGNWQWLGQRQWQRQKAQASPLFDVDVFECGKGLIRISLGFSAFFGALLLLLLLLLTLLFLFPFDVIFVSAEQLLLLLVGLFVVIYNQGSQSPALISSF